MSITVNGHYLYQRVTGVQRYAIEILKEFDRLGLNYSIAEIPTLLRKNKITQHVWEQFVLPLRLRSSDVLWSPTNTGPAMAGNHVITFHDLAVFSHPEWFSENYVRWRQNLIPVLAKKARGILTVSEFSKKIILEYTNVDPGKVKAIHNGVNRKQFYPSDDGLILRVREKLGLNNKYILTLGSLDPRKNLKRILQAWSLLQKEQPLFDYVLAVAGGQGDNFSRKFSPEDFGKGSVKYLGYVDDEYLAPLYSGACGFVYPSLFEGFGLPVLEAMSCGTPVITSNTGALKEISEGAAEWADPYRPEEIAQSILNIVGSETLAKELARKGKKRAKQFNWEKTARETYTYLKEFIP